MNEFKKAVDEASPEELKGMAMARPPFDNNTPTRSYKEVRQAADQPMQSELIPTIPILTNLLVRMRLTILFTASEPGFITSDTPCVWFDPELYKLPSLLRSPGLGSKTIQVTMPISPNFLVLYTHYDKGGYVEVNDEFFVDDLNRRTRFYCDEYFVVRNNIKKDIWFDPGKPPE